MRSVSGEMPRHGAVAVLDALGFKGIWRRYSARAVLERLKAITLECKGLAENEWQGLFQDPRFGPWSARDIVRIETQVAYFSDTVIICCAAEPGAVLQGAGTKLEQPRALEMFALNYVSFALSIMLYNASTETPNFFYRGAVSVGDFWFEDPSFIVGEAIDEAASAERDAEGAIVRFCPRASQVIETLDHASPAILRDYPVALKGDRIDRACVVNPFACLPTICRTLNPGSVRAATLWGIEQYRKGLAAFMASDDPAVALKKRNTERFLDVAASAVEFTPWDS